MLTVQGRNYLLPAAYLYLFMESFFCFCPLNYAFFFSDFVFELIFPQCITYQFSALDIINLLHFQDYKAHTIILLLRTSMYKPQTLPVLHSANCHVLAQYIMSPRIIAVTRINERFVNVLGAIAGECKLTHGSTKTETATILRKYASVFFFAPTFPAVSFLHSCKIASSRWQQRFY